jgi:hypothetical protein
MTEKERQDRSFFVPGGRPDLPLHVRSDARAFLQVQFPAIFGGQFACIIFRVLIRE